jgi:ribosomal protein S7
MIITNREYGGFKAQVPIAVFNQRAGGIGIAALVLEDINSSLSHGGLRRSIIQHPLRYVHPVRENVGQEPCPVLGKITPGIIPDRFVRNVRRGSEKTVPI